ncbi:hypothetical protein BGZ58_004215, partial [Dissophora ornata]
LAEDEERTLAPERPRSCLSRQDPSGELYHSEQGHRKKLATITNVTPCKQVGQHLSEDDLIKIFWKDETLRKHLRLYIHPTVIKSAPEPGRVTQDNVVGWLKNLDPGEHRPLPHHIRNVVKSKEDVKRIWKCDPEVIKFSGLTWDERLLSAPVPSYPRPHRPLQPMERKKEPSLRSVYPCQHSSTTWLSVYQPTFKHRRWFEQRRERAAEGETSIAHIGSSITKFVKESKNKGSDLGTFYNSGVLKKHEWDARRARDQEF